MMTERVQVNGVELAYEVHGSLDGGAVPLLLAHGYTGSRLDWLDVIDRLAASRPVVAYDHRGHGESSNTGDAATYTFAQLTADLAGFVDALGLASFDLLGHSMGGMVALRYMASGSGERPLADPDGHHGLAAHRREGDVPDQLHAGRPSRAWRRCSP